MSTHRIKPGKAPKLHKIDTAGTPDWSKDREAGEARALELNKEFEALQELLYAENKHRVLVVLQAMDTGGKDGVIRKVFDGVLARLRQQARDAGKKDGKAIWRRFFLVRDAFASLGPAAVLTVHRSQGSTFGEVFVDGDVFWPSDDVLRRQLVYVAVSRASQAVSLVAEGRAPADGQLWRQWLEAPS